ncbi:hypothetical protein [Microseira sp. BLCC-F43]|uniref:hypothetical protein n=1 Tax=Microseira sp. BLCC-F43 TaxID=3153602 RepID=UPI0035BBAF9B
MWRLALTGGGFPLSEGTCPPTRKLIVAVACLLAASRKGSAPDHARKALSTWSSTNLSDQEFRLHTCGL